MCPLAGNGHEQQDIWAAVFAPPIKKRLSEAVVQKDGAPRLNLTDVDVPALISLCPFDSVAIAQFSPWCDVFTEDELDSFEYYQALGKYYGSG